MIKLFLTILLALFIPVICFAQSYEFSLKKVKPDYYPWITSLSNGKFIELDNPKSDDYVGYQFRVVISTSEIYNSIYIEQLSFGGEGCCAKVRSSRMIDMQDFQSKFSLKGEICGIVFRNWITPTSFRFQFQSSIHEVRNINKNSITIAKI